MRPTVVSFLLCVLFTTSTPIAFAAGTREDYERSQKLSALWQDKVTHSKVDPHWLGDITRFWYQDDLGQGNHEYVLVDAAAAKRTPAFDHPRLAAAIAQLTGKPAQPNRLPLDNLAYSVDAASLFFDFASQRYTCDLKTYDLKPIGPAAPAQRPDPASRRPDNRPDRRVTFPGEAPRSETSPDKNFTITLKNNNLFLHQANAQDTQLTQNGTPDDSYEPAVFWSPDSSTFIALRTRPEQAHLVYTIESSPKDQLQPKLHQQQYLKPGDQIAVTKPHLFNAITKKEIPLNDELFPTPWSIDHFRWAADSSRFTFLYNQRGHQVLRIISLDAKSGAASALIDEQSKTFIDYTSKTFYYPLDQTSEILWMSERSGYNHLYLYDSKTAQLKNPVTQGPWVLRGVERVDVKARQVWFRASGVFPDQDPYYIHFGRVNFDGTHLTWLTAGDGTHKIDFSPDFTYLVDRYSRVDLPPITELRRADDGTLLLELEKADASALAPLGWKPPQRFVAKARDGKTDIFGVIHRPSNYNPSQKYPVIEDIYAGPQDSFVPKSFFPFHRQQSLAELGFIVVQIDGMGTNNRGKAFHDVCWKNLVDSGLPDRIAWIKSAAEKDPAMDLTRVGIYGGSAGGQSALAALLTHGDFYKAAVADCGCHDNRMDKIWWNEQWMGWPVGPHYAQQSNVTLAPNLTGKLLLFVGELDTNVDPASTMQVVNALIKADKDFDLVVFPGAGHGQTGQYGDRKRKDFFVKNLLGVEPRAQ